MAEHSTQVSTSYQPQTGKTKRKNKLKQDCPSKSEKEQKVKAAKWVEEIS